MTLSDKTISVSVAVIGGGPAGSSVALSLARQGVSVALIEQSAYAEWKIGESVPPACKPLLQTLGVWEQLCQDGHLPSYGTCSAWGSSHLHDQSYLFDPHGHGWHLDRQQFDQALSDAACAAGAMVFRPARFTNCTRTSTGRWALTVQLTAGNTCTLSTSFVVDAGGRKRPFACRQRTSIDTYDRLVGAVALLEAGNGAIDRDASTLVEAMPEGWWYAARIPRDKLVVAYLSDGDLVTTQRARTPVGWRTLVDETTHLRQRLEAHRYYVQVPPRVVSASSSRLSQVSSTSWLAVGDAAATYDPLSSQGILSALLTGLRATRAIQAILGGKPSEANVYAAYVDLLYAEYLQNRTAYYAMEQRWPRSLFWQRRHAGTR